jgi:hypothetical protein
MEATAASRGREPARQLDHAAHAEPRATARLIGILGLEEWSPQSLQSRGSSRPRVLTDAAAVVTTPRDQSTVRELRRIAARSTRNISGSGPVERVRLGAASVSWRVCATWASVAGAIRHCSRVEAQCGKRRSLAQIVEERKVPGPIRDPPRTATRRRTRRSTSRTSGSPRARCKGVPADQRRCGDPSGCSRCGHRSPFPRLAIMSDLVTICE